MCPLAGLAVRGRALRPEAHEFDSPSPPAPPHAYARECAWEGMRVRLPTRVRRTRDHPPPGLPSTRVSEEPGRIRRSTLHQVGPIPRCRSCLPRPPRVRVRGCACVRPSWVSWTAPQSATSFDGAVEARPRVVLRATSTPQLGLRRQPGWPLFRVSARASRRGRSRSTRSRFSRTRARGGGRGRASALARSRSQPPPQAHTHRVPRTLAYG